MNQMEQQTRMQPSAAAVEQYKREMLEQARRNGGYAQTVHTATRQPAQRPAQPPPIPAPAAPRYTQHPQPGRRMERAGELVEEIVETVEPEMQRLAPFAPLAAAGISAAAKGLEIGVDALAHHVERRHEDKHHPAAPAPVAPTIINNNIEVDSSQAFNPNFAPRMAAVASPKVNASPHVTASPRVTASPKVETAAKAEASPKATASPKAAAKATAAPKVQPTQYIAQPPQYIQQPIVTPQPGARPAPRPPIVKPVPLPAPAPLPLPPEARACAPATFPEPAPALVAPMPMPTVPPQPCYRPLPAEPDCAQLVKCPVHGYRNIKRPARCTCPMPMPKPPLPPKQPRVGCQEQNPWFLQEAVGQQAAEEYAAPATAMEPQSTESCYNEQAYAGPAQTAEADESASYAQREQTFAEQAYQQAYAKAVPAYAEEYTTQDTDYAQYFAQESQIQPSTEEEAATLTKVAYIPQYYNAPAAQAEEGVFEMPTPYYASLDDFLDQNPGRGVLSVHALTSDYGVPLQGADVKVTKNINGVSYQFYDVQTDAEGYAGQLLLPTPAKQASYEPPKDAVPYAFYNITVSTNSAGPAQMDNVAVFADTESVQVVRAGKPEEIDQAQYTL
jgi:hypothetical protein